MKTIIPEFILDELKIFGDTQGVLLTGSRTISKVSINSDWDFCIILKDGSPPWRKTWRIKNTWIEVFCSDRKQIEKKFSEELKSGRGVTTYMFAKGLILHDSDSKILDKLQKKARRSLTKGPSKLKSLDYKWIDYDISTYIQDIEDCINDNNPAYLLINHALDEFISYYYRLNRIWLPRSKDRLVDFKKREPELFKMVILINYNSDWISRGKLVIKFAKILAKKFDLRLDGEIFLKSRN